MIYVIYDIDAQELIGAFSSYKLAEKHISKMYKKYLLNNKNVDITEDEFRNTYFINEVKFFF